MKPSTPHPLTDSTKCMSMFPLSVQAVIDQVDELRHHVDDHWQIPRDEAQLLAQLVRIGRCVSICEIGTSYGFSTLHLAAAAKENGGHVYSIDLNPRKTVTAQAHIDSAGLTSVVTLHTGDARLVLQTLHPKKPFDFVFIDAVKSQSLEYLEAAWPKLATYCVVVTDNTRTHPEELAPFVEHLRCRPGLTSCGVMIGNGFELTIKRC